MDVFFLTLKQMLLMFTLILAGFILHKKRILPESSDKVMAKLLVYIFNPSIYLYSQITRCEIQTFKDNYILLLYGLGITVAAIALAYPLSAAFVRNPDRTPQKDYRRNVYRYSIAFSNYGFMGNFLVMGVWGYEMFYKYTLITFFVSIFCNCWGMYTLIPKDKGAGILKNLQKGLITPNVIAMTLGVTLGLLNFKAYIPDFLLGALDSAGKCQGPVAMLLAGFVIGRYDLKKLLKNKRIYLVTLLRLLAIPCILMASLMLIGTSKEIMLLALIAFATPIGLNVIVYPAAYGGETETGSAMTMISHALSVITIPIMYYIFMVLI